MQPPNPDAAATTERDRALAAALPRHPVGRVAMTVGSIFMAGMTLACLVLPFTTYGLLSGAVVVAGAVIIYLLVRWLLKRRNLGLLQLFTITPEGRFRALMGVGAAVRQARAGSVRTWVRRDAILGLVICVVLIGAPTALAVGLDEPRIAAGWLVVLGLGAGELPVLVARRTYDARRYGAEVLDPALGAALAADFIIRGGDSRRLSGGLPISAMVPAGRGQRRRLLGRHVAMQTVESLWRDLG